MFDCDHPQISSSKFKSYDWFDFYGEIKEDVLHDTPEARGLTILTSVLVDANLAGDKCRRLIQTSALIFCNKMPMHWHSKRQPTVESSTFGSESRMMKTAV